MKDISEKLDKYTLDELKSMAEVEAIKEVEEIFKEEIFADE